MVNNSKQLVLERKIAHGPTSSFSHVGYSQFLLPWHQHKEFEIMLFTSGTGKQFVGDGISPYQEGDITLIGNNVPHLHLCDDIAMGKINSTSSGEALQFTLDIFPDDLASLSDFSDVHRLLSMSQYGIRFYDISLYEDILTRIKDLDQNAGIKRVIQLYTILDGLSKCSNSKLLSEIGHYTNHTITQNSSNVEKVFNFLYRHFNEKILLKDIASFVNQDPSALCRAFKKATDKSIFSCLAEIRLQHACKLLKNSNLAIYQIAYECGYGSLSFFNEQFRQILQLTPSEYRIS